MTPVKDLTKLLTGLGDSLLGISLNGAGLVALSVDELVVDDLNASVVGGQLSNLIGNDLSISESRDVLANVGEAHDELIGVGSGQLSLGLLSEDDQVGVGVRLKYTASSLAETGVDTTAKTLVGAGNDEQGLLVLEGLGFGVLEDLVGRLTVDTRVVHSLLGAGKTGRGNDLHRVGDLLDVLDGLQTALNFTQSREVGGVGGRSASKNISISYPPIS
jgi:hypothetical protein